VKLKQHANPISQPEGKRQGGLHKNGKRQKKNNSCVLSQTDLPQEVFPILSKIINSLSEKNK